MARLPLLLCTAALASCAPLASFRPASGLMPERKLEVGAGVAAISPRPYVVEEWRATGQAWVSNDVGKRANVSGIVAFDDQAAAIGGALRVNAVRTDRFAAGVEGEGGYLWMGISVPVAVRLFDYTWLYGAPRFGNWGLDPIGGFYLGANVRIWDGLMLRGEWQRSWQDFKYYNRRDHYGGAVAYQF